MKKPIAIVVLLAVMTGASTDLAAQEYMYVNFTYDGGPSAYSWTQAPSSYWDGSAPGDPLGTIPNTPAPGGVVSMTEGGDTFLRIQDTGNPRSYGWNRPSNEAIMLGQELAVGAGGGGSGYMYAQTLHGAHLEFRIRLATAATGPVDDQYTTDYSRNPTGILPWPANGQGDIIGSNGKGMVELSALNVSGNYYLPLLGDNPDGSLGFSLIHGQQLHDMFYDSVEGWLIPAYAAIDPSKDYFLLNSLDVDNQDDGGDSDNPNADSYNWIELTTPNGAVDWQTVAVDIARTAGSDGYGEFDLHVTLNGVDKGTFAVTASWNGYGEWEYNGPVLSAPGPFMSWVALTAAQNRGLPRSFPAAFDIDYLSVTMVPEPTTLALALLGLGGLGLVLRRRR
ncbi:MAG: PEP-CTERM sorting domain-containing protein [Pirellulales bacterium]|nr:PEP-CTERM sorting domain-containing protein [Pirellulales bacterium]